jgi:hypothetical protein
MTTFDYNFTNLAELEIRLSSDRLQPYRKSVGGDSERAIRLYEQNTLLAESLYGILQGLEIALRNSIHAQLVTSFARPDWWNAVQLKPEQAMMLRNAEDSLRRVGKPLEASRIVAELSFGFWTGLTGPRYSDLWRNHLVKIFPRRPVQRADVQLRLNSIRKLRNRIAHHEPILGRPLQKDVNQIFDTLSWISPMTARWVRSNNSFEERFDLYRTIFPNIAGKKA